MNQEQVRDSSVVQEQTNPVNQCLFNRNKQNKYSTQKTYNSKFYQSGRIIRVSRKYPCEICGKPDWCSFTVNDYGNKILALCMRSPTGSRGKARNGAEIHVLSEKEFRHKP